MFAYRQLLQLNAGKNVNLGNHPRAGIILPGKTTETV